MKNIAVSLLISVMFVPIYAQKNQTNLSIGGYAQIDYLHPKNDIANIDLHRMVLYVGYQFNDRVSFETEVEFEHVRELEVEQAFVNYRLGSNLTAKAGLILVPMGLINQTHEPTTFFTVTRPSQDRNIIPSTWTQIGIGLSGNSNKLAIKYQAYIFNGIKSYQDGVPFLRGSDGLRKGRQNGANAFSSQANFSAKINYYGIAGLNIGLAGYFGNTQTTDLNLKASYVGLSMIGLDAVYQKNNWILRGQYVVNNLSNTEAYNNLTGRDVGSKMAGFYLESAYNILPLFNKKASEKLLLFSRYEAYNTQASVSLNTVKNDAYNRTFTTFGLNYFMATGAVFKVEYQVRDNKLPTDVANSFNMGIGVAF
ncbi:MAG: hypothetical protein L3J45_08620 [Flavobacteriaceae bacterium]|nr:hypothetical protein [Flavobacteriaceae bacterium]